MNLVSFILVLLASGSVFASTKEVYSKVEFCEKVQGLSRISNTLVRNMLDIENAQEKSQTIDANGVSLDLSVKALKTFMGERIRAVAKVNGVPQGSHLAPLTLNISFDSFGFARSGECNDKSDEGSYIIELSVNDKK